MVILKETINTAPFCNFWDPVHPNSLIVLTLYLPGHSHIFALNFLFCFVLSIKGKWVPTMVFIRAASLSLYRPDWKQYSSDDCDWSALNSSGILEFRLIDKCERVAKAKISIWKKDICFNDIFSTWDVSEQSTKGHNG